MSIFFPGEYLNSTYDIDFDKLYKQGYRAVIFDVDNTLVPHDAPADDRAKALFAHLKELGYSNFTWVPTGCVITCHGGPGAFGIVGSVQ